MTLARALMGVGYYRSQNAPDLALYIGDTYYAELGVLYARIGFSDTGQPYVDHSDQAFDGSHILSIKPVIKGKPKTREAHLRGARMFRAVWARLACPARGFAKSIVLSEEREGYVRSYIDNWRTEPNKGKRITVPKFEHTDLTLAIVDGTHALHTLSAADRAGLLTHFGQYRFDTAQIAAVLGCSPKTINTWRRNAEAGPTEDIDVREVIKQALLDAVKWQESLAEGNKHIPEDHADALAQAKAYRVVLRQRYGSDKTVLDAVLERANVVPISLARASK